MSTYITLLDLDNIDNIFELELRTFLTTYDFTTVIGFNDKNTLEFLVYDEALLRVFAKYIYINNLLATTLHIICMKGLCPHKLNIKDSMLCIDSFRSKLKPINKSDDEILEDIESEILMINMLK